MLNFYSREGTRLKFQYFERYAQKNLYYIYIFFWRGEGRIVPPKLLKQNRLTCPHRKQPAIDPINPDVSEKVNLKQNHPANLKLLSMANIVDY